MNKLKLFIGLLLTMILIMPSNLIAADTGNTKVTSKESATWLWNTREIVKDSPRIMSFLVKNNVKDLYLQVDYDLDLNSYKNFIEQATKNSINVHALDGSAKWATKPGIDKQHAFFNWVTHYQDEALNNQQFRGIHLDVEPYLIEQYHSNRNGTLEYYQDCLTDAVSQSKGLGLSLSVSIPFWFDEVKYSTRYGEGILAEWIISNVKNVVIMAYRDKALGDDGIIKLVSKEIKLAKQYNAAIIIGVETQRSDEGNNISFYEEGQIRMNKELNAVSNSYGETNGFGGFAIHQLMSWMSLKK